MRIAALVAVALLCSCAIRERERQEKLSSIVSAEKESLEERSKRWAEEQAKRRKAEDDDLLNYDVVMDSPGGPAVWGNGSTVRLRDSTGVGMYESYTRLTRRMPMEEKYRVRIVERRVIRLPDAFLVQYKVRFPPESGIKKEMWVESDDIWPPGPEHMD